MTDLLTQQAEIRAKHHPKTKQPREAGKFVSTPTAIELQVAAERMRERLDVDVPAMEHAEGRYWVPGHWATLPGYVPPVSVEGQGEELPVTLFDRRAA